MGLGKTLQTLALLTHDREQGRLDAPALVVCPTTVVSTWRREAERFAPKLRCLVHQGPNRLRAEEFVREVGGTDLVVTSYALLRQDAEPLGSVQWHAVILDEAQNIKNPGAKQSRLACELPAGFRVALTGTPVENRLGELWSIMRFLNPGYLGSRRDFRRRFALPIEREDDEEAAGRLRRLTSPLVLRRLKTDPGVIRDLPEKWESKEYSNLSEEQASLYEVVVREAMEDLPESEGIERKGLVLSMLTRLKQVCIHPAQFLHEGSGANGGIERSGKVLRLLELLEETLSIGDGTLIFTQYKEMGSLLEVILTQSFGVGVQFLHGGTPARKRAEMVSRFQEGDGSPLFILSLKAGGTGLNLARANHVFHFDRWWNPAVEDQATDRAFRIGQTRNVQVHKFVCTGTLEEKLDQMIEDKKALAESVVGEGWITEFSDEDLREMVALRREAYG
jgi:SNF2 family DNA or RNA helicase